MQDFACVPLTASKIKWAAHRQSSTGQMHPHKKDAPTAHHGLVTLPMQTVLVGDSVLTKRCTPPFYSHLY